MLPPPWPCLGPRQKHYISKMCGVSFSCFYMMLHDIEWDASISGSSVSTAEAGSSVFMVVGTNMFKLEKRMNLIAKTAKQNADEKIVLPDMVAHLALGTLGPPSILGVGGRDYVENAEQTLFITWLQLHGELLCCRSVFQNLLQHPITVRQFIDHFPRVAKQNLIFFKSVHMIVICWGEQVARAKDLFVLNENYGFSMRAIPQLIFPGQICQMTDIPVLLVGMGNEIWNFSRFMNEDITAWNMFI